MTSVASSLAHLVDKHVIEFVSLWSVATHGRSLGMEYGVMTKTLNHARAKFVTCPIADEVSSAIGVGMRSQSGVAQKMFQTLASKEINILAISTSEIKISVLIKKIYTDLAIQSLHDVYKLDKK